MYIIYTKPNFNSECYTYPIEIHGNFDNLDNVADLKPFAE